MHGSVVAADVGELRAPDAATGLADRSKAEAAAEQPGDCVPEPSSGQPVDAKADQEAKEADAMQGTPSAGACEPGQLSTSPSADGDHLVLQWHQCWTCNHCEEQHSPKDTSTS